MATQKVFNPCETQVQLQTTLATRLVRWLLSSCPFVDRALYSLSTRDFKDGLIAKGQDLMGFCEEALDRFGTVFDASSALSSVSCALSTDESELGSLRELEGMTMLEVFLRIWYLDQSWFGDPTESILVSMFSNVSHAVLHMVCSRTWQLLHCRQDLHTTRRFGHFAQDGLFPVLWSVLLRHTICRGTAPSLTEASQ